MSMKAIQLLLFFVAVAAASGVDVRDQTDSAYQKADAELNAAYQKVCALLEGRELASMRAAQRAWLTYLDAESSFLAGLSSEGGSAYSTDLLIEKTHLIHERTKRLIELGKRVEALR